MDDLELIVKLPEKDYERLVKYGDPLPVGNEFDDGILKAVANGKKLPKGCGKLADVNAVIDALKGIERLHLDDELRDSIINILYENTLEVDKEKQ